MPLSETDSWPVEWLAEILRLTYQQKRNYKDFSDRLRAVARASIGEVGYNSDAQLVRVGDDRFLEAVTLLQNRMKLIRNYKAKQELQQLLANPGVREMARSKAAQPLKLGQEINGKSLGRLPFITEKGHLVLTSEHVKRGDSIAIIKGAQVSFVLRQRGESHCSLISEAYVDGIMDGEAMVNSDYGNIILL